MLLCHDLRVKGNRKDADRLRDLYAYPEGKGEKTTPAHLLEQELGEPPQPPKPARALMRKGGSGWGERRGDQDRSEPRALNASIIRKYQRGGQWHSRLWHGFVEYCGQSYNDPDRCPEVAAAFVSLIEKYWDLADRLEREPGGGELRERVAAHVHSWPPDDASRSYLLGQPALVARQVLAGWNPRDKDMAEHDDFAAYYTHMINRVLVEVQNPLHWEAQSQLHRGWGSQSAGDRVPPGGDLPAHADRAPHPPAPAGGAASRASVGGNRPPR